MESSMKSANTKTSWNLLSKVTELVWQKEWIVPVPYFCYDNLLKVFIVWCL